jgi:hypothetical protein
MWEGNVNLGIFEAGSAFGKLKGSI